MTRGEAEPVGAGALDRVVWALRRTEMAVQALKEQRLRPLGMVPAHYSLLIAVHLEPGLIGAELARRLNVTPQAVASLVARLTERGHLERRTHPRHRHVQELRLTDAGRQALKAADDVMASIEQQITARLRPANTALLITLLSDIAHASHDTASEPAADAVPPPHQQPTSHDTSQTPVPAKTSPSNTGLG